MHKIETQPYTRDNHDHYGTARVNELQTLAAGLSFTSVTVIPPKLQ